MHARFTVFVFVSMLAYSTQDLILEPFAGALFGFTPGESTQLSGVQHGGTLAGMLLAALAGRRVAGAALGSLRAWTIGGCLASALALLGLVLAGTVGAALAAARQRLPARRGQRRLLDRRHRLDDEPGRRRPRGGREGTRMGLWGAAQAIGFALGGLFGAAASDLARWLLGAPAPAYASVFLLEALMFVAAAALAARIAGVARSLPSPCRPRAPDAVPGADPRRYAMNPSNATGVYDVVVVGGGPAGATAADDLARQGHSVLLLDRAGRIKPCGGAIPPRLIKDFAIPDHLLVARRARHA